MNHTPGLKGLTKQETEGLKTLFALLGDGRTKYGKRIRAYLDGNDNLDDAPTIRKTLDKAICKMKGKTNVGM